MFGRLLPHPANIILAVVLGTAVWGQADNAPRRDSVQGTIVLSTGEKVAGRIFMTRTKRLRVRDAAGKLHEFKLDKLARLTISVTRVRIEKEWYFKEEGSPEKVYSGRTYPRLDFALTLTPKEGKKKTYSVPRGQPIFVQTADGKRRRFVLQPYLKGEVGQSPADLVYAKEIVLSPKKAVTSAPPAKTDKARSEQESTPEDNARSEKARPR